MRLPTFGLLFLFFGILTAKDSVAPIPQLQTTTEVTCAFPNGKPTGQPEDAATCYGHDPCLACHDCSRCKHCNSGGSCGVCQGGNSGHYQQRSIGNSSGNTRSSNGTTRNNFNAPTAYLASESSPIRTIILPAPAIVTAATLNVRSGPGTAFEILVKLTEGDSVTITETAGEDWVLVEVVVWDGRELVTLEGYVYKKYISY